MYNKFINIISIGSYSFVLSLAPCMCAYVGYKIDEEFKTDPFFMIGLLFLGICMTIIRFYKEYTKIQTQNQSIEEQNLKIGYNENERNNTI